MGLFDKLKKMNQNTKEYFDDLSEKTSEMGDKTQAKLEAKKEKIKEKNKSNFYKSLDQALEAKTPHAFLSKINSTILIGKVIEDYKPVTMNYLDGYNIFKKSQKNIKVILCEKGLIINAGVGDFIEFNSIKSIEVLTEKEMEERFTMTHLALFEAYVLEMPRKIRYTKQYLVINVIDADIQAQLIFDGNDINDSYVKLIDNFTKFKKQNMEQNIYI